MDRNGSGRGLGESTGVDWAHSDPPIAGYTWPEFWVEILRLLRRVASRTARGFDPLEVLWRWLVSNHEGRSRPEQWRDAQRVRRLITGLRRDLRLLEAETEQITPRNDCNVNISDPNDIMRVTMGMSSSLQEGSSFREDSHDSRRASSNGKERKAQVMPSPQLDGLSYLWS